jgi:hypothetical protein
VDFDNVSAPLQDAITGRAPHWVAGLVPIEQVGALRGAAGMPSLVYAENRASKRDPAWPLDPQACPRAYLRWTHPKGGHQ